MDLIKLYYGSDSEEENEELVQNFLETVENGMPAYQKSILTK